MRRYFSLRRFRINRRKNLLKSRWIGKNFKIFITIAESTTTTSATATTSTSTTRTSTSTTRTSTSTTRTSTSTTRTKIVNFSYLN